MSKAFFIEVRWGLPTIGRFVEGLLIFQEVVNPDESLQLGVAIDDLTVLSDKPSQIREQIIQIKLIFVEKDEPFVGIR